MELLQQSIRLSSTLLEWTQMQQAQLTDLRDILIKYQQLLQTELDKQREIK
jgi:hypothetical protein